MQRAASVAIRQCMKVKRSETVLVITDEPCRGVGTAIWAEAKKVAKEALIVEITPRTSNGEEPPPAIAKLMADVDVVFAPTSKSLTHTAARRNACKKGTRVATMPGITEDSMSRTLSADYQKIAKLTKKLVRLLTKAKSAHITTPTGTDLVMDITGRAAHEDTGLTHKKGEYTNLPAGEAYLAPLEGKTEGMLVIDGSMAGIGLLPRPLILEVQKGFVTKISGGPQAATLKKITKKFGKPALNIAELGVGTNYKAKVTGLVLEDEKVMGTVHVAIGDNASMGGKVHVQSHLDGVLLNPTLLIDGNLVIDKGRLLLA
jgi:leucyl aminopeptidase (aminopeptidase T)